MNNGEKDEADDGGPTHFQVEDDPSHWYLIGYGNDGQPLKQVMLPELPANRHFYQILQEGNGFYVWNGGSEPATHCGDYFATAQVESGAGGSGAGDATAADFMILLPSLFSSALAHILYPIVFGSAWSLEFEGCRLVDWQSAGNSVTNLHPIDPIASSNRCLPQHRAELLDRCTSDGQPAWPGPQTRLPAADDQDTTVSWKGFQLR